MYHLIGTFFCLFLMASSALSPEFKDLPGEIMDIPDDVYEEHQESENTTTMDVNITDQLLKIISKVALAGLFILNFCKATFHAVLPSIVRLLYRYNKWAMQQKPLSNLIKYLYNLRTEDYWVYKTKTGRLKDLDGNWFSKK